MKYPRISAALLAICCTLSLTSCFKDEPLNAECDIEQAYIQAGENLDTWFIAASDTLEDVQSDQTHIEFTVAEDADITHLAPKFRITAGATIQPENGSEQDFSQGPVTYTVTSEDRNWSRTYTVSVVKGKTNFGKQHEFDFETYSLANGYYSWQETWNNRKIDLWATGNAGYKISNPSTKANKYPTAPEENGYEGAAVKLTTSRTSQLADMVKKPIAAGNLFIGQFDATNALRDAMKATKFGRPFSFPSEPLTLEGWYKYQAGDKFTDKYMNTLPDRHDYGTIYAVIYENHDQEGNPVVLYGDNVQTSPQVVALAIAGDQKDDNGKQAIGNTEQWTHFVVNFELQNGKTFDSEKLKKGEYSMAIVCSSSTEGADFMGAVGSTLWVDKLKITCK